MMVARNGMRDSMRDGHVTSVTETVTQNRP
jgi:hypothetical protein